MAIWEAPQDIRDLVAEVKEAHHKHLAQAKVWVLVNDANPIVDNQLIATGSSRCTSTEKLRTDNDFKIIVIAEGWHALTNGQRRLAIDEALCRCGVHYVPLTQKVNKKDEVIKDEIGRIVYTDKIATDGEGNPKWKINRPDASLYFQLLQRHAIYSDAVENVQNALANKPLKQPIAATQPDVDASDDHESESDIPAQVTPVSVPETPESPKE